MKCCFGLFVCLALFGTGCSDSSQVEKNSIEYSFNVYRTLFEPNENTVFSPLSFHVILSILYQGAIGQTKSDLQKIIFKNDPSSVYSIQTTNLDRILTSPSVKLANKLYLRQGASLRKSFSSIIEGYHSDVEQVDFSKAVEVANNMNEWVESKTNGLIKNLVESDSVTSDTALFLINTLYFKAKWTKTFSLDSVYPAQFSNFDGTKSQTQFMTDVDMHKFFKFEEFKAQVLELPYEAGSNFVFWIILPDEDSNITQLKENLNFDFIQKTVAGLNARRYDITLPIFEIESSVNGNDIFSKLGLSSLFNNYELDLLEGGLKLKVDEMKQKTKIIVNTEGTEAASSTYAKIIPYSSFPVFKVNRPFVYVVLTADNHEPVFVGHYSKV